eukprot:GHVT01015493.1.p2 GENE.GHVT01015493.1~~GHVT01015493.1.p2  ORF type:complete len:103 (+),score=27.58 GHVT01015493.1:852-1160(+)
MAVATEVLSGVPTADLLAELKRRYEMLQEDEHRLILLGPPGSGKGTQATELQRSLSLCHLSSGDLLREAVASGSDVGQQTKKPMDCGELVDDQVVLNLLEQK